MTKRADTEAEDNSSSQAVKAQLRLREMILAGELEGGERIAELTLVDMLGVSRTPIRAALQRLEQEGLLQTLPGGGFAVRTFSEQEAAEAIELRGTIEGLAVRLAAERGVADSLIAAASKALDGIDAVLKRPRLTNADFSRYVQLNGRFHELLREMVGEGVIQRELDRVVNLPFASPSAFVVLQATSPQARDMLIVAQDQHRQVLQAITQREGARAEGLMREHSRIARRNLAAAMEERNHARMPTARLIRRQTA